MSLANLIVQPTRAVLQADAGAFLDDGTVTSFHQKLQTFPRGRAAMCWRGGIAPDAMLPALYPRLDGDPPLEDVLRILPDALREATAIADKAWHGDHAACMSVVCYDPERRRPIGLLMVNDTAWFAGEVAAYTWVRVDNSRGSADASLADLLGRPIAESELSDPAKFDIERDSLPMIEAMRRRPWGSWPRHDPAVPEAVRIGGWVDQAEVTAKGVNVRRLVTWPADRLGERIAA